MKISAPVGYRGINHPDDVKTVQTLLNRVPNNLGGPLEPLNVDGICGRKTNLAIEKLQAKQFGWNTVTGLIRPRDQTIRSLMNYDLSAFIDNTPRPVVAPPPPPKLVGNRFMITLAAAPGTMLELPNFYFLIQDIAHPQMKALYFFGDIGVPPPLSNPVTWSITTPGYTITNKAIGADDWAGIGILKETMNGNARRMEMFFVPDVLDNHIIKTELHARLNPDQNSPGVFSSSINAKFKLIDSSALAASL